MEKKIYSKPVLTAEAFEPQEYIAGCYKWKLDLVCTGGSTSGDHYVFNNTDPTNAENPAVGQVTHAGHNDTTLWATTEDDNPPSGQYLLDILATVGEFPGAMANDKNTNGNPAGARYWMLNKLGQYQIGYAWYTNGVLHFHEGDMEWQLVSAGTGSGPNAS